MNCFCRRSSLPGNGTAIPAPTLLNSSPLSYNVSTGTPAFKFSIAPPIPAAPPTRGSAVIILAAAFIFLRRR
ncbi:MAG TPA: hypothetical protein VK737_10000 [Opitutales bacterium]|nr:hypothetical protein [Opitutales bacterium]